MKTILTAILMFVMIITNVNVGFANEKANKVDRTSVEMLKKYDTNKVAAEVTVFAKVNVNLEIIAPEMLRQETIPTITFIQNLNSVTIVPEIVQTHFKSKEVFKQSKLPPTNLIRLI